MFSSAENSEKKKPKGGTFLRLAVLANEMFFHVWPQLWAHPPYLSAHRNVKGNHNGYL